MPDETTAPLRPTAPTTQPPVVMVVDDNPVQRRWMAGVIEDAGLGVVVREAVDGAEAQALLAEGEANPPAALIIDMVMPRLDGRQLLAWLRGHPTLAQVPVVVVSSSREDRDRMNAMRNASAFLAKPVAADTLIAAVRDVLGAVVTPGPRRPSQIVEAVEGPPVRGTMRRGFRAASAVAIWLGMALVLGTGTLIGPIEATASLVRRMSLGETAERVAVVIEIALFLTLTTWLSSRVLGAASTVGRRLIALGITGAATVATLWVWATPGALGRVAASDPVVGSVRMPSGAQFDFGPFPSGDTFRDLKARGYSAVISLLHPAVVPVEPPLMQREASDASRAGMRLVPTPMLPWLMKNDESLQAIAALGRDSTARYFVHCYLGRDRVRMVQRFLIANGGTLVGVEGDSLGRVLHMERGSVVALAGDSVIVGPAPTDDELLSVILERHFATVVSLLYATDSSEARVANHEREALQKFGVPVRDVLIRTDPYHPEDALAAAELVRGLPRPVYIHAYRSDSSARTEAFIGAWRAGRQVLIPVQWHKPLAAGQAAVVAPAVALGPAPAASDWALLAARGIHAAATPEPVTDAVRARATTAGVTLTSLRGTVPAALEPLRAGGPWYVWGVTTDALRAAGIR
jgi:CheY-like chemotaxis protein